MYYVDIMYFDFAKRFVSLSCQPCGRNGARSEFTYTDSRLPHTRNIEQLTGRSLVRCRRAQPHLCSILHFTALNKDSQSRLPPFPGFAEALE